MSDDNRSSTPGAGAGEMSSSSSSSSASSSSSSSSSSAAGGSAASKSDVSDVDEDMVALLEAEMDGEGSDPPSQLPAQGDDGTGEAGPAAMPAPLQPPPVAGKREDDSAGDSNRDSEHKRPRLSEEAAASPSSGGSCPHPAFFAGMCVACGASKEATDDLPGCTDTVALKYIHGGLEVSKEEAQRLKKKSSDDLVMNNKLLLVLDLDHTLLNSTKEDDVADVKQELEEWAKHDSAKGEANKQLYYLRHMRMWTKLRPLAKEFLAKASEQFEMYIYTMGNRDYAWQMASILDPGGLYFHQRIISQNDSTETHTKSLDIIIGDETKVLIMDDTEGVWPSHQSNLVKIERYLFFPNAPGHFRLQCPSLMGLKRDEDAERGALSACLRVLQEVHKRYFEATGDSRDVRVALSGVKRRVLSGCILVMSRVFTENHPLTKLAVTLGAICLQEPTKGATHVIAGNLGTEKVRWAKENGAIVVSPRWIEASAHLWSKAPEEQFPVSDTNSYRGPQRAEDDMKNALSAAGGGS